MIRCAALFCAVFATTVATGPAGAQSAIRRTTLPVPAALRIVREEPLHNTTVAGPRPDISATFVEPVDPDTLHIRIDGRDVTVQSYVSDRSFNYVPGDDIPPGPHRVDVGATATGGRRLAGSWTFNDIPAPIANYVRNLSPKNGARVARTFEIRGVTRPGSRVHIVATSSATLEFNEVTDSASIADASADATGSFARPIAVQADGGGIVDVRVESRAPDGAVAVTTVRLRPQ